MIMYEKRKKTRKNRRFKFNVYKRINRETAGNLYGDRAATGVAFSVSLARVEFIGPDGYCGTRALLSQYVGGIIMTDIACPPSPFYRARVSVSDLLGSSSPRHRQRAYRIFLLGRRVAKSVGYAHDDDIRVRVYVNYFERTSLRLCRRRRRRRVFFAPTYAFSFSHARTESVSLYYTRSPCRRRIIHIHTRVPT